MRKPPTALPFPPMPVGLSQADVAGEGAVPVADDSDDARDGEADQDRVLNQGDADLGARGDPDPDHRQDGHHEADGSGDRNVAPGVGGAVAENGEHGRPEHLDPADRGDHVSRDHQPADQEPEARVHRPGRTHSRYRAGHSPGNTRTSDCELGPLRTGCHWWIRVASMAPFGLPEILSGKTRTLLLSLDFRLYPACRCLVPSAGQSRDMA